METIEYRNRDKKNWGSGDWQDEPDKKQWHELATGYPCLIVRNRLGRLCGYVGVSPSHPAYRLQYDGCTAKQAKERLRLWRKAVRKRGPAKAFRENNRYPNCTVIPGLEP